MLSLQAKLLALLALVISSPLASAHSWVEEYQVISDNGSYTGPRGYSRGFVSRADPTYDGFSMMWMLPSLEARNSDGAVRSRINSSDLLCHPSQRTSNYTADFPKLKVSPGDYVAAKYLENGHVSLPWNITGKPPGSGTIFIFGTSQPSDTEKISDVMEWNTAGTGGNGKGFLLTAQNFDDGRCHQINCGSISEQRQILTPNHVAGQPTSTVESWCETDIKIPTNLTAGTLTTYWVWQWPTEPNADCNTPAGKDEYYTTCADFEIVDKAEKNKIASTPTQSVAAVEGNPQSVAVSDYKSRTAYTSTPSVVMQENDKIVGKVASVNSAFVSACSAQAPVISQYSLGMWPEVFVPNSCSVVSTFGPAAASAAANVFDSAAASYTSGSKSAWSAAFAAAKIPLPTRSPWSQAPNTGAAQPTATPDSATPTPLTTTAADSSSAPQFVTTEYVTTITTVVSMDSQPSASSAPAASPLSSASAPAASPSSPAPAPAPPSDSAPTYSAPSGAAGAIPTISTVGNANATIYRKRNHARNFVRS
ncbi:hypothetical protein AC578_3825 [Pseudocercospora eumusae]|uniref:DUF7492 domain-containing protein n=1 Tax=Pseudocercospora eumusae TaxID=321146 RepID=A0A139HFI1_9PEZI|nr:hypothetical protein AC578_3825 [Pseudocercospora eumusae]